MPMTTPMTGPQQPASTEPGTAPARALAMSTVAFTVCFAVWTIFSIIGLSIKEELGLTETQSNGIDTFLVSGRGRIEVAMRGAFR